MNKESKTALSNNNLRRMQGWARAIYPNNWQDRCAIVVEYLSQQDEDAFAVLIKKEWPVVFEMVEKEWPEAFVGWAAAEPSNN